MSILSQKTDIFERISILKTSNELYLNSKNKTQTIFSTFDSSLTNNNKDPFLFVIDILKILAGSNCISTITNQLFSTLNKTEINYKSKLQMEYAASNGGSKNSSQIPNSIQNGTKIHINKIDYTGNLFRDDTNNLTTDTFSNNLKTSIQNPGQIIKVNNALNSSYDSTTGYFTFTPTSKGGTYNSFTNNLINNTQFIDQKVLLSSTLDILFNTSNKNNDQLTLEAQMDIILNKFITETDQDNSYFTFNTEDLSNIQTNVILGSKLYTEVGCGRVATQLTATDINNITSGITYPVSKLVISNTINNISDTLLNNSTNPNLQTKDKQSVANNYQSSLLTALKNNIVRMFMISPQLNIIHNIVSLSPLNNNFDPIGDLQARKNLIKCMMKQIIHDLVEGIFKLIEKELLEIVAAVALIYAEEAFEKYKNILKSI